MRFFVLFSENVVIAIRSIRSNLTRAILTILIIAFGIMALVGILTAIDSIKGSISDQFTNMGANTFTIKSKDGFAHGPRKRGKRSNNLKTITYKEAARFKQEFNFPAIVSVYTQASNQGTLKFKSEKTNPNIPVFGIDENYLQTSGFEIEKGRNFTQEEIRMNRNYAIIGSQLVKTLFKNNEDPLDKIVSIGNGKYKIIGVLKEKGSSLSSNSDMICLLPLTNVRMYFAREEMAYEIAVMPGESISLDVATGEAEGLFRKIRKLTLRDLNNFEIQKSDSLVSMFLENIQYVTIAATIIGIITLLGAAIGLMNIMLVAVSERTREIGTRKAIGATSADIRQQFLFETIIIGQLGGALGIILGIFMGNIVSMLTGGPFIIPWLWIFFGVFLCLVVSLASGMIPAMKASKLDPIIALRYE
ncbi:MAG: ABC transporter [Bacteroidetes bacterium GWF2_38_335]|nr:MAG: ABC transporter [Bacteroidetes bacterium GWF2_38_335]OFY80321.1 MAG: ABC transporter [Bacteroidetes bacterium RIFOXYA12_FULL_38_20]HBS88879.1 ABC transporter [Bacteroidales bacterium]